MKALQILKLQRDVIKAFQDSEKTDYFPQAIFEQQFKQANPPLVIGTSDNTATFPGAVTWLENK